MQQAFFSLETVPRKLILKPKCLRKRPEMLLDYITFLQFAIFCLTLLQQNSDIK